MGKITLCLGFSGSFLSHNDSQHHEVLYSTIYRNLASVLYAHPDVSFSMHLSGALIEWLQKQHPEFFMTLEEMTSRKQLEMIGGGYNEPLFPLIPPSDRVGQIELLTTALRRLTGKRPRGCWLPGSAWDPSLISSCNTCGMEYVLLDSRLIAVEHYADISCYEPLIVEDIGKTVYVLPMHNNVLVESNNPRRLRMVQDVIADIRSIGESHEQAIIVCFFSDKFDESTYTTENGLFWLEEFINALENEPHIELSTAVKSIKNMPYIKRKYITAGAVPFTDEKNGEPSLFLRNSIRQFLLLYPESLALYARMMYTHTLVAQIKGDRQRKLTALEEIWKAQANEAYWSSDSDSVYNRQKRYKAYKHLIQAEKIARECMPFNDSLLSFDFDFDGLKEYIAQFPSFDMYIHSRGGALIELDIIPCARNYTDTMLRVSEFDGVTDTYPRKMCIDHLVDEIHLPDLLNRNVSPDMTLLSTMVYQETHFDRIRHLLSLKVQIIVGQLNQQVTLKKHYLFTAGGAQVQYILKNESPLRLSIYFAVESNLSLPSDLSDDQSIEIIAGNEKKQATVSFQNYSDVSYVQIHDTINDVQFVFEPNENAFISIAPLTICRPHKGKQEESYQATNILFYWKMDFAPFAEMEKTIFYRIKTEKLQNR